IISGELGLKDFNMLKNWFKENGKPGSREFIETQEMLSKLYDLLASKDKH
ncbi:antitoxin, partial [Mobiluncus curtisii]|nr:antitoxin [Mobiluncus curtisii]